MQNFLDRLQILKYIFLQVIDVSEAFCIVVVLTLLSTLQCLNIVYFSESQEPDGVPWKKGQLKILLLCINSVALSDTVLHKINDLM